MAKAGSGSADSGLVWLITSPTDTIAATGFVCGLLCSLSSSHSLILYSYSVSLFLFLLIACNSKVKSKMLYRHGSSKINNTAKICQLCKKVSQGRKTEHACNFFRGHPSSHSCSYTHLHLELLACNQTCFSASWIDPDRSQSFPHILFYSASFQIRTSGLEQTQHIFD